MADRLDEIRMRPFPAEYVADVVWLLNEVDRLRVDAENLAGMNRDGISLLRAVTAERDALLAEVDRLRVENQSLAFQSHGRGETLLALHEGHQELATELQRALAEVERMREVYDAAIAWAQSRNSLSADCRELGISGGREDSGKWGEELARRCEPLRNVLTEHSRRCKLDG